MALFSKKTEIKDNKNAVITVGDKNLVAVTQKLSEISEKNLTNQANEWVKVVEQLKSLQDMVKSLGNENEELRDQILVPTLSKTKKQAETLAENPEADKKGFVEQFKSFCDAALKVADVAAKVIPFVTTIAKIIGVPLP